MKKVIWKYQMEGPVTTHKMPIGSEFLCVQKIDREVFAWFLFVESDKENLIPRKFKLHGTGHSIGLSEKYLGTFQDTPFIWHLFEDI